MLDFSEFDSEFRLDCCNYFVDMRAAFYAGYNDDFRQLVLLGAAGRRLAYGNTLVSTTFVVPYPPGFPVLVPGQVISKEILYFLAQLDVKEIHGYNPDLGLSVFTEAALARLASARHAAGAADAAMKPSPASASPRPDRNSSSADIQVAGRSQASRRSSVRSARGRRRPRVGRYREIPRIPSCNRVRASLRCGNR